MVQLNEAREENMTGPETHLTCTECKAVWVSAQAVQGLGRAPRVTALALSPNALAFAAVGPGAGGAGCRLRINLLPCDAGNAPARDAGAEEPAAAFGIVYGDRRAPCAGEACHS